MMQSDSIRAKQDAPELIGNEVCPQPPQAEAIAPPLKRNAEAELLRFIFAVMVFLSHMNVLPNGALAVDFFFLLTGYLMVASIQKARLRNTHPKSTVAFIFHKIKSFYPELLVATVISIVVYFIACPITFDLIFQAIKTAINGIVPILKMTGIGISVSDFNGATWYLSSMLLGLILVYPLFVKSISHSLLFIFGIALCGFLCVYHGQLNGVYTFIGITYEGNIRAVGELLLGGASYHAIRAFSETKITVLASVLVALIKYAALGLIIVVACMDDTRYHSIALCSALVLLILVFSRKGIDKNIYANKLFIFLGSFSLPLYISHRAITACQHRLIPFENSTPWLNTIICFVYSAFAALIVLVLAKLIRKKSHLIKNALICQHRASV